MFDIVILYVCGFVFTVYLRFLNSFDYIGFLHVYKKEVLVCLFCFFECNCSVWGFKLVNEILG